MRRPPQDALRNPQQRRTAQKNAAEARAGSIVGRHQASAPRPRPQDRIPEVAEGIGLPCVPEDHRRDEASLARSSGRPTIPGSCAAPLLLEKHMGGDTPLECLPDTRKEPALQQVRRLGRDAEFAAAQATFEQRGSSTVAVTTTADASAIPKASAAAA